MKEHNIKIAKFMGFKEHLIDDRGIQLLIAKDNRVFSIGEMEYHRSWDWLMPVVDKIENTVVDDCVFDVLIEGCHCNISNGEYEIDVDFDGNRLNTTYTAVVNFISWYNLQR